MEKYEITILGSIQGIWDERYENWKIEQAEGGYTKISGCIRDQAELYGILAAIRNMGLKLIRLEKIIPDTLLQE